MKKQTGWENLLCFERLAYCCSIASCVNYIGTINQRLQLQSFSDSFTNLSSPNHCKKAHNKTVIRQAQLAGTISTALGMNWWLAQVMFYSSSWNHYYDMFYFKVTCPNCPTIFFSKHYTVCLLWPHTGHNFIAMYSCYTLCYTLWYTRPRQV